MSPTALSISCLATAPFFCQVHDPPGGHLRESQVRFGGLQIGLRLLKLLVGFGSFDLGEQVAFVDVRADIGIPLLQIAVGARIDRRVDQRLRVSRQHQLLGRSRHFGMRDRNREDRGLMRFGDQCLRRQYAGRDAFVNKPADRRANRQQYQRDRSDPQAASRTPVRFCRFIVLGIRPGFVH